MRKFALNLKTKTLHLSTFLMVIQLNWYGNRHHIKEWNKDSKNFGKIKIQFLRIYTFDF
jgi:hypothetical protein